MAEILKRQPPKSVNNQPDDCGHSTDEDEVLQAKASLIRGKRSTGRRSSILKRALADIDLNVELDGQKLSLNSTRGLSIPGSQRETGTCKIQKKFPRDSPQTLKVAAPNDSADTSADADSSLNTSNVATSGAGAVKRWNQDVVAHGVVIGSTRAEVAQPLPDHPAGSSSMLEEGETTFMTDMANEGGFRESTRRFDRLDNCVFGEVGMLDVSEITQGENTVFVSALPSPESAGTATCPTTMPSGNKFPTGSHGMVVEPVQPQPIDRMTLKHPLTLMKRSSELKFPSEGDRTLLFDNQEDDTMDLTLMDTTSRGNLTFQQHCPEVSALDLLNKITKGGRKGSRDLQEREVEEQHTVMFSNTGIGGGAMELTQNLTEQNLTSDFRLVPQLFNSSHDTKTLSGNTVFATRSANEMNTENMPRASAKLFLASLQQNRGPVSGGNVFAPKSANDMSTENMPKASAKSFLATLRQNRGPVPATMSFHEREPDVGDLSLDVSENEQRVGGEVVMYPQNKHAGLAVSNSNPVRQECSVASVSKQVGAVTNADNEEEFTEMMELTGCMDNTLKPLVAASCSGVQPEVSKSSRNALMDITAECSMSAPSVLQQEVDREHISVLAAQSQAKPLPQTVTSMPAALFTEAGQVYRIGNSMSSGIRNGLSSGSALTSDKEGSRAVVFPDQENINSSSKSMVLPDQENIHSNCKSMVLSDQENIHSNSKSMVLINQQSNRVPLKPVQADKQASSSPAVDLATLQINSHKTILYTEEMDGNMSLTCTSLPSKQAENKTLADRTVLFRTEGTAADMSMTCAGLQLIKEKSMTHAAEKSRSILFRPENTAANMSLTCADLAQVQLDNADMQSAVVRPTEKQQLPEKSAVFAAEATAADMSLTCISFPSKLADEKTSANRSGQFRAEEIQVDMSMNRSSQFRAEETVADMSLTCADLQTTKRKSIMFKADTSAAANKSLTCADPAQAQLLPDSTDMVKTVEKSIVFKPENTAANMSLTCADLAQVKLDNADMQSAVVHPTEKQQLPEKSAVFAVEATAANMSFTCADLTQKHIQPDIQSSLVPAAEKQKLPEKTVVFTREATAANMSLTCADLASSQNIEQKEAFHNEANKMMFKSDQGDTAQKGNSIPYEKCSSWEKKTIFSEEMTAANMSLTYTDLPAVRNPDRKVARHLEEAQMITIQSGYQNVVQGGNVTAAEVCQPSEKSVLFSKDATEANISLTCIDVPAMENQEHKQWMQSEKRLEGQQNQETTKTGHQEVMDMTCMSPVANWEGKMEKSGKQRGTTVPSCHETSTQNQTPSMLAVEQTTEAQKNRTGVQNAKVSGQSREEFGATGQEDDDVFFKREPTTLMEITSMLDNLRKKMGEGGSSEESEGTASTTQDDTSHHTSTADQSKPEHFKDTASRKLQLTSPSATNTATETSQSSSLPPNPLKTSLPNLITDNDLTSKTPRLSSHTAWDSNNISSTANKDLDSSREPKLRLSAEEEGLDKTADSLSSVSKSKASTDASPSLGLNRCSNSGSSSSGHSLRSVDIFSETMPVFGAAASTSAMTLSAQFNSTASFLSLGKSFAEKQEKMDESASSFLQTCEQLGITQSDLKGWVCRRSSIAVIPEISCDTVKEQLNTASVTKQECEFKVDFVNAMDAMQQREEASSEEMERTVLRQINQQGLVALSEQSPSVRQQIRSLLFASRKHAQVMWKTSKAEKLTSLAQNLEKHNKAASAKVEEMVLSIEQMVTQKENIDNGICQLQRQLEHLQHQASSQKKGTKVSLMQQELQQQCSDLTSLQEKVTEAKRSVDRLTQREKELQSECERIRQRQEMNLEQQKQLAHGHDTLSALHRLHCWRPVSVEEQQIDISIGVPYNAVLLSVRLSGSSSPSQPIASIEVTSRLKEGTQPWETLATELAVDAMSSSSQQLMRSFPTRQHLPLLLDTVTELVEDIKELCLQVKMAALHHRITIRGRQVTATLWSMEQLRKVSLTADIPVTCNAENLCWSTQVVMGDIGDKQLQAAISQAGSGRNHFAQVLQAVHTLLQQ